MKTSFRFPSTNAFLTAAAFLVLSLAGVPASVATAQSNAEPSYLKDLDIRQVPMARDIVLPMPSSASGAIIPSLAVKSAVNRPDARYTHGDNLVLSIEVTEDAYVWVFDTGTSGKVHQIFPNRHQTDNFVRASAPVSIPDKEADYQLLVSHPKGPELITVIASKDSAPLTQDLIDRETQAGPVLALRGDAASVAKDLSISLKKTKSKWVGHHLVIHIE